MSTSRSRRPLRSFRDELKGWDLDRFDADADGWRRPSRSAAAGCAWRGEAVAAYRERKKVAWRRRFSGPADGGARPAARPAGSARPSPGALPLPAHRRVAGHRSGADGAGGVAVRRRPDAGQALRGGRRQPVDLPLPRGRRPRFQQLRERMPRGGPAGPDPQLPQPTGRSRLRQCPVRPVPDRLPAAPDATTRRSTLARASSSSGVRARAATARGRPAPRRAAAEAAWIARRIAALVRGGAEIVVDREGDATPSAAGAGGRRGAAVPGHEQRPPLRSRPARQRTRLLPRRRPGLLRPAGDLRPP